MLTLPYVAARTTESADGMHKRQTGSSSANMNLSVANSSISLADAYAVVAVAAAAAVKVLEGKLQIVPSGSPRTQQGPFACHADGQDQANSSSINTAGSRGDSHVNNSSCGSGSSASSRATAERHSTQPNKPSTSAAASGSSSGTLNLKIGSAEAETGLATQDDKVPAAAVRDGAFTTANAS